MIHDQHCHTSYSLDSKASIKEYAKIANKNNTKYFVCTDHIEFDSMYNNQNWTVDYDSLKKDLIEIKCEYPNLTPLLGIEIGYRKDHLEDMINTIKSEDFDVVNMSIHDNGVYDYYVKESFTEVGINNMLDIYFNNIIDALDTFTDFNVLSHFDYGFKTAYKIDDTIRIEKFEDIVRKIFRKIIKLNKVVEINLKVQFALEDTSHLETWLKWYYEEGGRKLTISSDAHESKFYEDYYQSLPMMIEKIKKIGYTHLSYFVKRKEYQYEI